MSSEAGSIINWYYLNEKKNKEPAFSIQSMKHSFFLFAYLINYFLRVHKKCLGVLSAVEVRI